MKHILSFALVSLLIAGCASKSAAPTEVAPSGKWSGDYGIDKDRRDPIEVELRWEHENLTGAVNSGPRSMPLTNATFTPSTGAITMEFDAQGNRGQPVHYKIDGKVSGNVMSGTWSHDDFHGDFRVTK